MTEYYVVIWDDGGIPDIDYISTDEDLAYARFLQTKREILEEWRWATVRKSGELVREDILEENPLATDEDIHAAWSIYCEGDCDPYVYFRSWNTREA
jgi:hypothetical protein